MVKYKTLYEKYQDTTVLLKVRTYARWTVADIAAFLLEETESPLILERDFQSFGAQLVNNLSNKLMGILFPQSRPFFRIKLSRALVEAARKRGKKEADLQGALARRESEACAQLYLNATYANLIEMLKHLIVTGNAAMYRDSIEKISVVYGLANFSVKRDGHGRVLDAIIKECVDYQSLKPELQAQLRRQNPARYRDENQVIKLEQYTRVQRKLSSDGKPMYEVSQQIEGLPVGTPGTYPEILCPWQFPTWRLKAGENYGRGLVEDNAGDFAQLSDLSHALVLYQVAASKVVNLAAPGAGSSVDDLNNAETGEWVQAAPASVSAHEGGDARKIQQMRESISEVMIRLSRAFMYQGNTRDAERVTAYEVRTTALEVDQTLGGTYSSLASSIQIGLSHLLLLEVDDGLLEAIVTEDMKLDIVAGIPALGRQADVQNLLGAAQDSAAIIPALQQLDSRIDTRKIMDQVLAGYSVDPDSIFKSEEQIKEDEEAAKLEAQGQEQLLDAQQLATTNEQLNNLQGLANV